MADKNSPTRDHEGRPLWKITFKDHYKKVYSYQYAWKSKWAIGYAEQEVFGLQWSRVECLNEGYEVEE